MSTMMFAVTIELEENSPPNTPVYNVTAIDPENQQIMYDLESQPHGGSFKIDSEGKYCNR